MVCRLHEGSEMLDMIDARTKIVSFIRERVEKAGADGVVLGVSGGVDSAVAAYLAVEALGHRRVHALIMPDPRVTPESDMLDAKSVVGELGIQSTTIDIAPIHSAFMRSLESNRLAEGNLRARIRMALLYYFANVKNHLVLGTGDRSELLLGYFCYDDKTRVVTSDGAKWFSQLKEGDSTFCLDTSTLVVNLKQISGRYSFPYQGRLIGFESDTTDLRVTPNHRMLVARNGRAEFIQAARLALLPMGSIVSQVDERPKQEAVRHGIDGSIDHKFQRKAISAKGVYEETYRGTVWCVEVPYHHNLLVERNGRLSFSGNTKYGDGGADLLPIADLYKSEVRSMGEVLGVNRAIIIKKSSPRLWASQTAEDEIGLSYSVIDRILQLHVDGGNGIDEVLKQVKADRRAVDEVLSRIQKNEHKRTLPPICKLR